MVVFPEREKLFKKVEDKVICVGTLVNLFHKKRCLSASFEIQAAMRVF